MTVSLVLELYKKQGGRLANMLVVEESDRDFLREILSVPNEDPLMYGAYRIDAVSNEKIFKRYGIMLDVVRYDCYAGYRQI